jgi:hypothetical protein
MPDSPLEFGFQMIDDAHIVKQPSTPDRVKSRFCVYHHHSNSTVYLHIYIEPIILFSASAATTTYLGQRRATPISHLTLKNPTVSK